MSRFPDTLEPHPGMGQPSHLLIRIDMHTWGIAPEPAPTPPVVSNVTPIPGTPITPTTAIGLDVTDTQGLRRVILTVAFPSVMLGEEVIHNGSGFAAIYSQGSTRTAITNGWRYSLVRSGGWPAAPVLTPYAFDVKGAEA